MKIIQKRGYFLVLSALAVVVSLVMIFSWGLRAGVDFTGGTQAEIGFSQEIPSPEELTSKLEPGESIENLQARKIETRRFLLEFSASDDQTSAQFLEQVPEKFPGAQVEGVNFVSSVISQESRNEAIVATLLAVIGIAIYIAWAFRGVSFPVSSWVYGGGAVAALVHDVLITLGVFAYLGKFYQVEVGVPFVAALLTILGYSVNDTIVIFDRIRENLRKTEHSKSADKFEQIVNNSVVESLGRSASTSITVVVVLLALVFLGSFSIKFFSLALMVGVILGTYSSIFVASALVVEFWKRKR